MWLATELGFFSAVRKGDDVHLRARIRADLARVLKKHLPPRARPRKILEWPAADYRWRVLLAPGEFAQLVCSLAMDLDYPNFKSRIAGRPDQAPKLRAYGQLWAELARLQSGRTRCLACDGEGRLCMTCGEAEEVCACESFDPADCMTCGGSGQ